MRMARLLLWLIRAGGSAAAGARERKMLFSLRNFVIVLALSIHSVFEGMAVGKATDKYTDAGFFCPFPKKSN